MGGSVGRFVSAGIFLYFPFRFSATYAFFAVGVNRWSYNFIQEQVWSVFIDLAQGALQP